MSQKTGITRLWIVASIASALLIFGYYYTQEPQIRRTPPQVNLQEVNFAAEKMVSPLPNNIFHLDHAVARQILLDLSEVDENLKLTPESTLKKRWCEACKGIMSYCKLSGMTSEACNSDPLSAESRKLAFAGIVGTELNLAAEISNSFKILSKNYPEHADTIQVAREKVSTRIEQAKASILKTKQDQRRLEIEKIDADRLKIFIFMLLPSLVMVILWKSYKWVCDGFKD